MNTHTVSRIVIYTKDVQRILGKSERRARAILAKIRIALSKVRHQPVSITEFCTYMNLSREEVEQRLIG